MFLVALGLGLNTAKKKRPGKRPPVLCLRQMESAPFTSSPLCCTHSTLHWFLTLPQCAEQPAWAQGLTRQQDLGVPSDHIAQKAYGLLSLCATEDTFRTARRDCRLLRSQGAALVSFLFPEPPPKTANQPSKKTRKPNPKPSPSLHLF